MQAFPSWETFEINDLQEGESARSFLIDSEQVG